MYSRNTNMSSQAELRDRHRSRKLDQSLPSSILRHDMKNSVNKKILRYARPLRIESDPIGQIDIPYTATSMSFPGTVKRRRIHINVGGIKHEILRRTIRKFPSSRLYYLIKAKSHDEITELCDDYDLIKGEFYFDRNPETFSCILDYYRTGKLHLPSEKCSAILEEELIYWKIDEWQLEPCCRDRYQQEKEESIMITEMMDNEKLKRLSQTAGIDFHHDQPDSEAVIGVQPDVNSRFERYKNKIWTLFEEPNSSTMARVLAIVSVTFIILSTVVMCLGTIQCLINNSAIYTVEVVCIVWFTFEFIVRFISSPSKWRFLKGLLNIIDFVAILPFYINLIVASVTPDNNIDGIAKSLLLIRMLRVLRVLKLARHSSGLQVLGLTLQKSWRELFLLNLFLTIGVTIFSGFVYYAEKEVKGTKFKSIPATFWWGYITMTTVGYGDAHPTTLAGQIVGILCCITGVLVVALPIPIIFNNFNEIYMQRKKEMKFFTKPFWFKRKDPEEKNSIHYSYSSSSDEEQDSIEDDEQSFPTLTKVNSNDSYDDEYTNPQSYQIEYENRPASQLDDGSTEIIDHNNDVNQIRFKLMEQLEPTNAIDNHTTGNNTEKVPETIV